jgi:hydroxymethylglutaryl-CoA reductase
VSSRLPGFYRLSLAERRARLAEASGLGPDELAALDGGLPLETADGMIENVVGTHALPLAVALNFQLDGADVIVPMCVEEPSVVAAASNAAKMVRDAGGFTTSASPPITIGQLQITHVADVDRAVTEVAAARERLLAAARAALPRLVERGGGPVDVEARIVARPPGPDGGVVVVHLLIDCRDAMGANMVNGVCEALADDVAAIAGGRAGLRILSNLGDRRVVTVTCRAPDAALAPAGDPARGTPSLGAEVRAAIAAASRFAEADPYRAATHNKGIMNGVDAVLLATGQDWRAVEAGAHAYAALHGGYRPLATWREDSAAGAICGTLTMPLAVGTVGGALHVHAGARAALRIAGVTRADQLARIAAAAGLASNLAALRALATEGIQRGHMSLHARVVARSVGASGELVERVASELTRLGDTSAERAREILARLAHGHGKDPR